MSARLPLFALALALAFPGDEPWTGWPGTREVAEAFRDDVLLARDFEAAVHLCAPDFVFSDPTVGSYDPALSQGIRGRGPALEEMKGYGIRSASLALELDFTAGPYAVFYGRLSTHGASTVVDAPFLTVLRVDDERVAERTDYGDYDQLLPAEQRIDGLVTQRDHPLVKTAEAYLDAYARREVAELSALLRERATFHDPTAIVVGGGQIHSGRSEIAERLSQSFAETSDYRFAPSSRFFFGDHALFAGTSSYSVPGAPPGSDGDAVRFEVPLVVVLRIQDGLVVRHTEYAGHEDHLARLETVREQEREGEGL